VVFFVLMALHPHSLFDSMESIPEIVPSSLWLPENSEVRLAKAESATAHTTFPLEMGYYFYEFGGGAFSPERALLDIYQHEGALPDDFLMNNWGNHVGRIMLKGVLDPDRYAPINLVDAYKSEVAVRGHNEGELKFFSSFVENWGVLKRG
jgi:hypothetical protein